MGKWTPDYVDDVLHAKIKNLVAGAISRCSLEKTEPTIGYESFVKDLDTGDSFTTAIIDILVKELAERRTRPSPNDRRLIADRSAKSLRLLATPIRVYRDRSMGRFHPSRRSANLTEYLTAPPSEMDLEEDEDIFERMLDNGTSIEGVRLNSDLYEAYGNNGFSSSSAIPGGESPVLEEPPTTASTHPPNSRSGPWSLPPAPSVSLATSSLTRQPSIRRPVRSRTVDFNDFTHRRRSSIRDAVSSRADSTEPTEVVGDGPWIGRSSQSTRRFFPFSRTRRPEITEYPPWSNESDGPNAHSVIDDNRIHYISEPSVSGGTWFTITPPHQGSASPSSPSPDTHEAEISDERIHIAAPRLRRGGLRAPESMLSRHASPLVVHPIIDSRPTSPSHEPGDHGSRGDAGGYPTPGSTDNENLSS